MLGVHILCRSESLELAALVDIVAAQFERERAVSTRGARSLPTAAVLSGVCDEFERVPIVGRKRWRQLEHCRHERGYRCGGVIASRSRAAEAWARHVRRTPVRRTTAALLARDALGCGSRGAPRAR